MDNPKAIIKIEMEIHLCDWPASRDKKFYLGRVDYQEFSRKYLSLMDNIFGKVRQIKNEKKIALKFEKWSICGVDIIPSFQHSS